MEKEEGQERQAYHHFLSSYQTVIETSECPLFESNAIAVYLMRLSYKLFTVLLITRL